MRLLKQALQDVVCILFSLVSFTFLDKIFFFDETSFPNMFIDLLICILLSRFSYS